MEISWRTKIVMVYILWTFRFLYIYIFYFYFLCLKERDWADSKVVEAAC